MPTKLSHLQHMNRKPPMFGLLVKELVNVLTLEKGDTPRGPMHLTFT